MFRLKVMCVLVCIGVPMAAAGQVCRTDSIPASTPDSRFTVHGNGTVTDKKTGLMWKVCSEGRNWRAGACAGILHSFDWQDALDHAQSVRYLGYSDWRLPNMKELSSIVEYQCYNPSINLSIFPRTPARSFWSSSPSDDTVNFYFGGSSTTSKDYSAYVRLVRGGQ